MADAGIGEAILISSLIGGAATLAGQTLFKPNMPGIPDPGPDPGKVPDAGQAARDAASLRQRQLQRHTLDSFRVDPAASSAGIQIPSP